MVIKYFAYFISPLLIMNSSFALEHIKSSYNTLNKIDQKLTIKYHHFDELFKQEQLPRKFQQLLYQRAIIVLRDTPSKNTSLNELLFTQKIISLLQDLEVSFNTDLDVNIDELEEDVDLKIRIKRKKAFKLSYFFYTSFISWNYTLKLENNLGEQFQLFSKEKGYCLGGGIIYNNSFWGIQASTCYALLTATVGEDSNLIKYNQFNIPISSIILKSGVYLKPKQNITIGIYPVLVLHNANYSAPTTFKIIDKNSKSFGYLISTTWLLSNFQIDLAIGDINSYQASLWSMGIKYIF